MSRSKPGHARRSPADHVGPGAARLTAAWAAIDPGGVRFNELCATPLDAETMRVVQLALAVGAASAAGWAADPVQFKLQGLLDLLAAFEVPA